MSALPNPFNSLKSFKGGKVEKGCIYSLPALEEAGLGNISRLPICLRIVLESVLRNCDGENINEKDVETLAGWNASQPAAVEIPFTVSRIVLQDFTGVPLLVDLAAMRDAVKALGRDPNLIEPLVPVDLVIDHSVQVDRSGTAQSFLDNLQIEFDRNRERYRFLKWGQQAFKTFSVVPPSIGIVHQVNLEYLARLVFDRAWGDETLYFPDTLVGTDSHTTMINGMGIVGWGVGGIEAEAGMLGQPVSILTPEVIGVHLSGTLVEGVTATDLTLRVTEMLRNEKVVGKFIEFFGEGASNLTVADRATIANMAPEYGATIGFFPVDDKTLDYLRITGRTDEQVDLVKSYYQAQQLYGIPRLGEVDYTKVLELDLQSVRPCVAGPKRPQDRIEIPELKRTFIDLFTRDYSEGGYGRSREALSTRVPTHGWSGYGNGTGASESEPEIGQGTVLIAAITSCTNTSNPSVMIAAGLLAKNAVERGLSINSTVKTSLAPGSRVVTDYLNETGLQVYLDQLGFNLVGYGCTTCIGNSGPLDAPIDAAIKEGDLITASVLSGNRNFEARIHSSIKANFLMSPPLVVAFALAGRVDIDLSTEPLGEDKEGAPVFLKDLWPTQEEIQKHITLGLKPEMFREKYSHILDANPQWDEIEVTGGTLYNWDSNSTYIQPPPFFENFGMKPGKIEAIYEMRLLAIVGDSVTTDHISPAGSIAKDSPAGQFLISKGVEAAEFNSFGSRRGNDRVMTRGTFGNVRFRNLMAEGKEGGYTKLMPEGKIMPIYDACQIYAERNDPLIVFAGNDYGMGSSRDWAAKGATLLGVKAVVASSFERIHRSNLIGMGVLPLQFKEGDDVSSLKLQGRETFSLPGLDDNLQPGQGITFHIKREDGTTEMTSVIVRIDTQGEIEFYRHGGILQYVLRNIVQST